MHSNYRLRLLAGVTTALVSTMVASPSNALSIVYDYSQLGTVYQDTAGQYFSSAGAGRSDVTTAFKADAGYAALILEKAIKVDFTTKISVTLSDLTFEKAVGDSSITMIDPATGYPTASDIRVDNGSVKFFTDLTPADDSEFDMTSRDAMLGGGMVNVARIGNGVAPEAAGRYDLVTLFTHEVEHSLAYSAGLDRYNMVAGTPTRSGFDIPSTLTGLPSSFFLALIPNGGSHIDGVYQNGLFNDTVVADPGFGSNQRAKLTGAEIYGACYVLGCTAAQVDANPFAPEVGGVPEPTTWAMLTIGFGMVGVQIGRRRRQSIVAA